MNHTFLRESPMPVDAAGLYAWHARPGAFDRLVPPWEQVRLESWKGGEATRGRPLHEQAGDLSDGAEVTIRMGLGPLRMRWVARHQDHIPGRQFVDVQISGPFAAWRHSHRFLPRGDLSTLQDEVSWTLPLGPLGERFGRRFAQAHLERMFQFRHARTAADLARHAPFSDRAPLRIAMTGASGLVGRALTGFLRTGGHTVLPLVRRAAGPGEIGWDPAAGQIQTEALEGLDAVIHLAGESVDGRWTTEKRARILSSRKDGTDLLARALARLAHPPATLVSASATGFYGDRGEEELTEEAEAGSGFLAEVVQAWESAADPARAAGIRVVLLRTGVVLTSGGGALKRMLLPFQLGLGGPMGGGQQWMPWISLDDLCGLYLHALMRPALSGAMNAVSPEATRMGDYARALGCVLRRPAILPVPAALIGGLLGEMGRSLLLSSARVQPARALAAGVPFLEQSLEATLRTTLGRANGA